MKSAKRVFAHRGLWKQVNYAFGVVTYVCSSFFLLVGIRHLVSDGASTLVTDDLLVALWFLLQGIFLFGLNLAIDRRRRDRSINFPDRRNDR